MWSCFSAGSTLVRAILSLSFAIKLSSPIPGSWGETAARFPVLPYDHLCTL
jgi:hypothetical protein